jgi:tetratricopeptide (TPR) repeat protein
MTAITIGSLVSAHRLERSRRETEDRLHEGERLLEFMLGDLGDRLESVGRLDVMEATFAEVERFYANVPSAQQSPASLRFRGEGFVRFGDLRADEGKLREAETNYLRAIEWFLRAGEADPGNDAIRFACGKAWNGVGIVYARQGDFPNAGKAFGECYAIRKTLVAAQPDNPLWLRGYAAVAQNLAQFSRHSGDLPKALDYIRDAVESYRRWYQLAPTNAQARAGFGTSVGTASQLYQELKRWSEAEQAAREGIRIFREGLQTDSRNARFAAGLAQDLSFLGQVQMTNGQPSAAVETLSEGARWVDEYVQRDPGNGELKMLLSSVLVLSGAARQQLGDTTNALADWQRVIALSEAEPEKARQFAEWNGYWRSALEYSIATVERLGSIGDAGATERETTLARLRKQLSAMGEPMPNPSSK